MLMLVLASLTYLKAELMRSDPFDQKLHKILIKMMDVYYGGENRFNQIIDISADTLGMVRLTKEKNLLQKYMNKTSQDTGKYCFMVDDAFKALELDAVEDLVVWENIDTQRIVLRNTSIAEKTVSYLSKEQQSNENHSHDLEVGVELEIMGKELSLKWFANDYKNYGCNLELVTNHSEEGT